MTLSAVRFSTLSNHKNQTIHDFDTLNDFITNSYYYFDPNIDHLLEKYHLSRNMDILLSNPLYANHYQYLCDAIEKSYSLYILLVA